MQFGAYIFVSALKGEVKELFSKGCDLIEVYELRETPKEFGGYGFLAKVEVFSNNQLAELAEGLQQKKIPAYFLPYADEEMLTQETRAPAQKRWVP